MRGLQDVETLILSFLLHLLVGVPYKERFSLHSLSPSVLFDPSLMRLPFVPTPPKLFWDQQWPSSYYIQWLIFSSHLEILDLTAVSDIADYSFFLEMLHLAFRMYVFSQCSFHVIGLSFSLALLIFLHQPTLSVGYPWLSPQTSSLSIISHPGPSLQMASKYVNI